MNSELDAQRVKEIFEKAIEFTSTDEREQYLNRTCNGDVSLLPCVQALLRAHFENGDSFLPGNPVLALAQHNGRGTEEKPGDVIGRYKLLQKIGEGGCGIVWMAEQAEPVRRRVALKVIKLGMDTKAVVARFQAERQALAIMDHPNIAKVHDAGATETGRPFFVMELVRGIPITKYCDENHLTPKARLELFIKVCQAVHHAHQKAIIHRDLKPSNILVTVNDGAPTPKIIDFGIAKATQGRLTDATVFTAFEQFIGTPVYMSPEQAEMSSLDIDTRSDIYSLGVLLYELLTGKPPLDPKALVKAGVDQIRQHIREIEPPTPSRRLHTLADDERTTIARLRDTAPAQLSLLLRGDLDWIVMRCLEKDRTRRYDTANGLAMDIQRHLQNEPVVARPPSTAYLLQKLIRRHRVGFAATVAIALTLAGGAIVSTWQMVRAKDAEEKAETSRQAEAQLRYQADTARQTEARLRQEAETAREAENKLRLETQQRAYAADMQLVPQALANANITRARELLYRYKPLPGQPDLCGWEWRYLWQLCQPNWESVLCEDAGEVRSLSTSRDGRWLAVAGGRLSVWDLATGKKTPTPLNESLTYARVVFASRLPLLAAYAFDLDSTSLEPRHRIIVWNYHTREIEREIPLEAECAGLFFSDDSKTLGAATLSPNNKIILWNVADGGELRTFSVPQRGGIPLAPIVAAAPDLSAAAHTTPSGQLRVIDLKTGRERWVADAADEDSVVVSVAFSADGRLIASSGGFNDRTVRVWDAITGKLLQRFGAEHIGLVFALLFWPDGKTLATANADSTIRIWDVASGKRIGMLQGHKLMVSSIALLPDNSTLISGGRDGIVSRWNVTPQRREDAQIELPERIGGWRFAEDGKSLLTAAGDGRIIRWRGEGFSEQIVELETGPIVGDWRMGREQFSPGLRYVALQRIDEPGKVQVWDTFSHRMCATFDGAIDVYPVAHFRDDHTLRVFDQRARDSVRCREWDLRTGSELRSWQFPVRAPLPSAKIVQAYQANQISSFLGVTFSADGERCLISNSATQPMVVYDLRNGASEHLDIKLRATRFPQFSPDGSLLAGREGYDIKLWETVTFREVASLPTVMRAPQSVAFSPKGERVAVGNGPAPAIILWNPKTHESVLTLDATGGEHSLTAFSPDGNRLGSRSTSMVDGEGILSIWRAPTWEEIEAAEKLAASSRPRQ